MLGGNLRKGSRNRRLRTEKSKSILLPSTAPETFEVFEQKQVWFEKQKETKLTHPIPSLTHFFR